MDYFEKLKNLISDSKLSENEKVEFLSIFEKLTDNELKPIVDLFEEKPFLIQIINTIYKAKKDALKNNDEKLWKEILKNEIELLKKL